jgi:hypothetical protein
MGNVQKKTKKLEREKKCSLKVNIDVKGLKGEEKEWKRAPWEKISVYCRSGKMLFSYGGEGGIWFRNKIYRPYVKVQYRNEKRQYCSLIFLTLFLTLL